MPKCSATVRAPSPRAAVDLARGLLELVRTYSALAAGLLTVEHLGADLDRVGDRLGRVVAGLLVLADDARGGLVLDRQVLDGEELPAVVTRGCLGVAASMVVQSHRTDPGP